MNKKIGILGLVLATSTYLASCNNNNQNTSSNVDSGSDIPSSLTSENTSEKSLTIEEVYTLLKTTYDNLLNVENYTNGFTASYTEDCEYKIEIDNENVDFGEVNPDGSAWTDGEQESFLQQINDTISMYGNSFLHRKEQVSYDLINNVGYDIYYYSQEENDSIESSDGNYNKAETVIAKDGDNKYMYIKEINNFWDPAYTDCYKMLVGDDIYKEMFSGYTNIVTDLDYYLLGTVEEYVGSLKEDFVDYDICSIEDVVVEDLSFALDEDVYSISVKLNYTGTSTDAYEDCTMEYFISFVPNEYLNYQVVTNDKWKDSMDICPDNDQSGVIPYFTKEKTKINLQFTMEYESENCPTIDADDTYEDMGNYRIEVDYYIDGNYLFNSSSYLEWGTEVTQLKLKGADQWFKEDMQWYLDPECTIPFTEETWPCYSFDLYTSVDSINEDYALVGHYNFSDDEEYQESLNDEYFDYYYDIFEVSGERNFVSYSYAYLNGERIENDVPIVFTSGIVNYIAFID